MPESEARVAPRARADIGRNAAARSTSPNAAPVELPALRALADPEAYLANHSRSFRFAASLMTRAERARVTRVYAWCRYTDNLVDDDVSTALAERRLDGWLARSREAYEGREAGIELVNRVMGEMAEREIPFSYAHDLVRAMRADLHFTPYADLDALGVYTYRAAGVVGRWLTELHGVCDTWMLERATALGQAMQLTNILRDVGEDLERGRMYLPLSEMQRCGVSWEDIDEMRRGEGRPGEPYRALMETLVSIADADYDLADEAIPRLPSEFKRAAAVASAVYRGIHGALRRNGYDNVRRRAYTSRSRKVMLAGAALLSLARSRVMAAEQA
jgi:15-cis-phytoene synthase